MIHPFFLLLFFVLLYTAVLYKSGAALTLCVLFIFWFLASVFHVLYNLRKVQIDFPFSAYAAIEHIPVIEVEFVHLAGLAALMTLMLMVTFSDIGKIIAR